MMIVTTAGDEADVRDGRELRRAALARKIPIITTIAGAKATGECCAARSACASRAAAHGMRCCEAQVLAPLADVCCVRLAVEALKDLSKGTLEQVPLQDYF